MSTKFNQTPHRRRALRLLNVLAIAFFMNVSSMTLFAQTDRGSITGTVTDPGGAVLVGASVSTSNVATGFRYETVTSSTGNFTLPSLPVGTYEVTVEAPGFNRFVRQGITIQIAQVARIDIILSVGSVAESVTINADAPLLRTENPAQCPERTDS